jgi:hypothetical protein
MIWGVFESNVIPLHSPGKTPRVLAMKTPTRTAFQFIVAHLHHGWTIVMHTDTMLRHHAVRISFLQASRSCTRCQAMLRPKLAGLSKRCGYTSVADILTVCFSLRMVRVQLSKSRQWSDSKSAWTVSTVDDATRRELRAPSESAYLDVYHVLVEPFQTKPCPCSM